MRVVTNLEKPGSRARPIVGAVVRLGPKPGDTVHSDPDFNHPETHALPSDLVAICSALSAGEFHPLRWTPSVGQLEWMQTRSLQASPAGWSKHRLSAKYPSPRNRNALLNSRASWTLRPCG